MIWTFIWKAQASSRARMDGLGVCYEALGYGATLISRHWILRCAPYFGEDGKMPIIVLKNVTVLWFGESSWPNGSTKGKRKIMIDLHFGIKYASHPLTQFRDSVAGSSWERRAFPKWLVWLILIVYHQVTATALVRSYWAKTIKPVNIHHAIEIAASLWIELSDAKALDKALFLMGSPPNGRAEYRRVRWNGNFRHLRVYHRISERYA